MRRKAFFPGVLALSLTTAAGYPVAAAEPDLPDIGGAASAYLSIADEQRLGDEFMRNIRGTMKLIDDDLAVDYVQRLGARLALHAPTEGRVFDFFIPDDSSINAFAGPGGHIGINSGLILMADGESELAAVMAHEIAHVTQRHLARAFEQASHMNLPLAAAIVTSIILGSRDGQAGAAALAATAAGSAQTQINFTRANEQEADRVGLEILAKSGYDPRSMPEFFQRLQQATRIMDSQDYEFLRTHPVTTSRIADSMGRAEQFPKVDVPESDFLLIRAGVRIASRNDPAAHESYFRANLDKGSRDARIAAQYGLTLALLQGRNLAAARTEFRTLQDEVAGERGDAPFMTLLLDVRIALEEGYADKAVDVLERGGNDYRGRMPFFMLYTDALLQAGRAEQVRELTTQRLAALGQSADPRLYRRLAEAEAKLGRKARAHQALAEFYFLNSDTGSAIQQIEIALSLVDKKDDGGHLADRLKVRLNELKELARADRP
ncbi:MAG: M48 family metalloprotease [Gammaproteobacteria bacterium]|nr:M48 family metalloprotease [Gammaproteobacteria bacterium]